MITRKCTVDIETNKENNTMRIKIFGEKKYVKMALEEILKDIKKEEGEVK